MISRDTAASPEAGQQNLLRHGLRVLSLYRWTWISVTLVLTLAVTAAVFTITPLYTAECLVLIEPGKLNITEFKDVYDPTMSQSGPADARQEFAATQHHLMLSDPVLDKVFLRFRFGEHERFRGARDPIDAFRHCFVVEPIRRTRLARICFQWADPEMAARALSHLVRTYIDEYRRRRMGITEDGLRALEKKAVELKRSVKERAQALQRFMVENNMVSLEDNQDIVKERLKEISANLTQSESERIEAESLYRNIKEAVAGQHDLVDLPEVNRNQVIRDLKLELVKVVQQIDNFDDRFGQNHPEMRRMVAQRRVLQGRLDEEIHGILAAAEAEYDRERRQESELREALNAQERKVMEQNRLAVQYNLLKESFTSTNNSYRTIIKRVEEIEIASAAGTKGESIFEITPPKVPTRASFPRKKQSVLLAILAGLVLGIGLSFLLHALDRSIKGIDEVEQELGAPVLGQIPAAVAAGAAGAIELHGLDEPRGPFAESFRSLKTSLALARAGGALKRLLVTSPAPGEGKDLVSVNTAISLARGGKRVVLIDCDMRRPRQHKIFGGAAAPGLSNLLAGREDVDPGALLRSTPVPGLSLLTSGPIPPNPVELISSARMLEVITALEARFDVLVFNSPPVMAVTDPIVLSQLAQGTVLVIRAFSTRRDEARRAIEMLKRADATLLGVVLNLVDVPRTAAGYYAYGGSAYGHGAYAYVAEQGTRDADSSERAGARSAAMTDKVRIRSAREAPVGSGTGFES